MDRGAVRVFGYSATQPVSLEMDSVVISEGEGYGVSIEYGTFTATDVEISDLEPRSGYCASGDSGECAYAVHTSDVDTTWTRGVIEGSLDVGIRVDEQLFEASDLVIRDNVRAGILVTESAAALLDNVWFDGNGEHAMVVDAGYLALSNGTVKDGSHTVAEADEKDESLVTYTYGLGHDASVTEGTLVVTDSTFESGEQGIDAVDSDVQISGTTFSSYGHGLFDVSGGSLTLDRVAVSDSGGALVTCENGAVHTSDLEIDGVTTYESRIEIWQDKKLVEEQLEDVLEPALIANTCDLSLADTSVEAVHGAALVASDSSIELDDTRFVTRERGRRGSRALAVLDQVVRRPRDRRPAGHRRQLGALGCTSRSPRAWPRATSTSTTCRSGSTMGWVSPASPGWARTSPTSKGASAPSGRSRTPLATACRSSKDPGRWTTCGCCGLLATG